MPHSRLSWILERKADILRNMNHFYPNFYDQNSDLENTNLLDYRIPDMPEYGIITQLSNFSAKQDKTS
jgi:hypothetical protein